MFRHTCLVFWSLLPAVVLAKDTAHGIAGHTGKSAFFESADGKSRMKLSGQIQPRYQGNLRNNSGDDDTEFGFHMRRAKLTVEGTALRKEIGYYFQLAAHRKLNAVGMEDAWIDIKPAKGWIVRIGRFKNIFLAEELISSKRQMAAERTSMNEFFGLNRTEGVQLIHTRSTLRLRASVNDGAQAGNIGSDAATGSNDFDKDRVNFAVAGRAEYKVGGTWGQFQDFSSQGGEPTAVIFGAAAHFEQGETDLDEAEDMANWTVDVHFERSGLSAFAAAAWMLRPEALISTDDAGKQTREAVQHFGYMAQAGYRLKSDLEPFARYEAIEPEALSTRRAVTFGINQYFESHKFKLTADVIYALDTFDDALNNGTFGANGVSSGLGLRADAPGETGQIAGRLQLQLVY